MYNSAGAGTYTVTVQHSTLTGATASLQNDTEFTTRVGASQLAGGAVTGGGTLTCAGVFDENFVHYASTCP